LDSVRFSGVPLPAPTPRVAFREMTSDDLDDMAALLGDPEVMRYYPDPKEAATMRRPRSPGTSGCTTSTALGCGCSAAQPGSSPATAA
jgi:Acetyltransferase (GNAT) domain